MTRAEKIRAIKMRRYKLMSYNTLEAAHANARKGAPKDRFTQEEIDICQVMGAKLAEWFNNECN